MKVLSLFDWISCGRIALERAWIKVDEYYASEIDKNAIQVSQDNYKDIIQLWDIKKIKYVKDCWLPEYWPNNQLHYVENNLLISKICNKVDIIIWWSPCQSFSVAWKQEWFDWKSWLFYEYIRLLKEIKPKYFLLENVKMKKEWQEVITNTLKEIYPETQVYNINSKLVSAQLRNRFYRTNIPWVVQPRDKWILLQNILDNWCTDREKARAILESESRPLISKDKMWRRYFNTWFTTIVYENNINDKDNIRYFTQKELERLQTLPEWYTKVLNRNKAAWVIWNWWTVDVIAHIFSFIK